MLIKGDFGYFLDYNGLPNRKTGKCLDYNNHPSNITCFYPYMISINDQGLAVIHNLLTCSIIQAFGIDCKTLTVNTFYYEDGSEGIINIF